VFLRHASETDRTSHCTVELLTQSRVFQIERSHNIIHMDNHLFHLGPSASGSSAGVCRNHSKKVNFESIVFADTGGSFMRY